MDTNDKKKLIILGATEFAEIAFEYFQEKHEYEVVAFSVNREYIKSKELKGKPIVPFEEIEKNYDPDEHYMFTAITYGKLNRVRERFYLEGKSKGYKFASYISPYAYVDKTAIIGEDSFIFENNTIQYNVKIGNGVVLWSGNHIGHSAQIGDFSFVSSHVVISGYCIVGDHSFCGVNSTMGNNIELPANSVLAAGAVITHSGTEEGKTYAGNPCRIISKSAYECMP